MSDPREQVLAGRCDAVHQHRRRLEIPIGMGHAGVAEIGAETGHVMGNRLPVVQASLQ